MKNKIKLISKGVLLYSTLLLIMILLMAVESIVEQNAYKVLIIAILVLITLIIACKQFITEEELNILTFKDLFNHKNNTLK
jgi:hypothetical protein